MIRPMRSGVRELWQQGDLPESGDMLLLSQRRCLVRLQYRHYLGEVVAVFYPAHFIALFLGAVIASVVIQPW